MKNIQDVHQFEKLEQQLHSMLAELSELSKKRANDGVNKFKLGFINQVLENLNELLGDQRPFKSFEKFDEVDLPTNSDVVIMLAQYASAVFLFRSSNTKESSFEWYWVVNGKVSSLRTKMPSHYKYPEK